MSGPPPLRATYRLQLTPRFGFAAAGALAPYLAQLGVSHAYLSPIFAARPGSTHGYDGVDHNRLNPELGSEEEFAAMCEAFRAEGLGVIADFVPNHVGIGGASDRIWADVLEWGQRSSYAAWFDIDWETPYPGLRGKVLAPFLGDGYGATLADGALALRFDAKAASFAVWAHDTHELPVRPEDYAAILLHEPTLASLAADWRGVSGPADPALPSRRAALRAAPRGLVDAAVATFAGARGDLGSWAALDNLIARQNWRVARHTLDTDAINYRRFFTISELAGLRIEDPAVFDAVHRLLFDLIGRGDIDGVRIDHIDGLRDPKAYMLALRDKAPRPVHRFVEKILAEDEPLRADWATDGATGYEVANLLVGVLVNPAAESDLTDCCAAFTGVERDVEATARAAKVEIMRGPMAAEVEAIARRLHALAETEPRSRDLGPNALREALIATVAAFDVYRTYADADGMTPEDQARVTSAVARARAAERAIDPAALEFIEAVLTLSIDGEAAREVALRTQQLTGPVMAKGFEDCALYRLPRLIALNEVGGAPGRFGIDFATFHAANAERLAHAPRALIATSTHDTKRGEDARTRISAISWVPELWRERVFGWRGMLEAAGAPAIDQEELYFFFQLLLGAWPAEWDDGSVPGADLELFRDRVAAGMLKSIREAGRNTRWIAGDPDYEAGVERVVTTALDPRGEFFASFRDTAATIGAIGMANTLAQVALKLTIPGVPDLYQGAEFWEQSLVDPDNRRPVDFAARRLALGRRFAPDLRRPAAFDKMALTARLLAVRKAHPALFAIGSYEPLAISGLFASRVCAFVRREGRATMIVAVAVAWAAEDDLAVAPVPELDFADEWEDPFAGSGLRIPDAICSGTRLHSYFPALRSAARVLEDLPS